MAMSDSPRSGTPPAKRQCVEETRPKSRSQCLAEVEQAVDQLDVSETGREMLRLLVKSSHGCPVKERHRYQDAAARLVEEAFQDEEEFLQARNREAADKAEKCRSDAQERAGKLRTSKEGFTAAISAFRAAKEAFLADNQVLQQRRRALDQSTQELRQCQAKLREATGCKDQLQQSLAALPGILEGTARDETVSALLGEVALEDSLKTAALSSLKLPAEARGSFDKAVLEQLHGALTRLLEALPTAEAEQLAVEEARVSEEAAASAFAQAREAQRTSAHALRLSELELRWAQGAEGAALECLQEQEQELRQFERELKAANEALNQFRHGPMASLKVLQETEIPVVLLKTPTKSKQDSHVHDPTSAGVPTPVRAAAVL